MTIERRSIIKGLIALVAAPAIVKVGSLMPVNAALQPGAVSMRLIEEYSPMGAAIDRFDILYAQSVRRPEWVTLEADGTGTLPRGTRETIWTAFDEQFGADGAKIGDVLCIRLPADFKVHDGPSLLIQEPVTDMDRRKFWPLRDYEIGGGVNPLIPAPLAIAAAAVALAPEVLAKPVTRRFWAR